MNIGPLIYFGVHHGSQVAAMFRNVTGDGGKRSVEYLRAIAPLLVKDYPQLAEQNLLNDAIAALDSAFSNDSATHWPGYPDPTNT